jgi:hypothetical protein
MRIKKEEGATDVATDSEDVKSEHPATANHQGDVASTAIKEQDDDDVLTSLSLHEDLEIFDGLQFEDGGGIIDMSFHSLGPHGGGDDDVGDHDMGDPEGTDAPGQDDDEDDAMDDHVYDDDEDENDHLADGETPEQATQALSSTEAGETADSNDATTDFPSEM